ncbi:MAG: endonuclease V [Candidatus Bathyarchaeia archaeon]
MARPPNAVEMPIRIPSKISPRAAIILQKKLAPLVSQISDLPEKVTRLVGCDAAYFNGTTVSAATLVDYDSLELLTTKSFTERTRFPYIPGLLAFREGPAVLRAIRALRAKLYICLVDAHGLAHPRKFGLACLVGVALNRPTIGVAKSLLYGWVQGREVVDREGYPIAQLVQLPQSGKTIYVSVGHKVSLKDAVEIVKHCLTPRGPAPINFAHEEVSKQRWRLKKSNPVS